MPLLPASPRARRRLVWVAAAVALVVVGGTIAVLLPESSPPSPAAEGNEGPAQLAVAANTHIPLSTRREIDRVLDRFIPAAVGRKDADTAWALAGPELRASSSLGEWRRGNSPVPTYPVAGTTFHAWKTIDAGPRYVVFNILLHPTPGADVSSYEFSGEMVENGDRWLVNRLYTIAVFNRVTKTTHEIGPADFAAPPPGPTPNGHAALGDVGLLPVVGLLALVLLVPLGFGAVALRRHRRWRRHVRSTAATELPPLPQGYLRDRSERPETLSRR